MESAATGIEAAVDATPGIDRWCSGPDWVFSVRSGFAPDSDPIVICHREHYALLASHPLPNGGRMIAGFEPLWGFACPLVGESMETIASAAAEALRTEPSWRQLVLPGFPDDLELARRAGGPLSLLGRVGAATGIVRQVSRLDGYEHWLSRRSRTFRRNLRNATRRAAEAGLVIVEAHTEPELFDRLLAIERTSWKGAESDGMTSDNMQAFYRVLTARLQQQDRCRCLVAQLDGADVGFVLGGIRAGRYRGLQLSYAAHVSRLSVGHLLQRHQIERLCAEGVEHYDLGMDMPYKHAWSDTTETSVTLVVERA